MARLDGGRDAEMEPLLLRRITETLVAEYRERFEGTEIRFTSSNDLLPIAGHITFIRQILGNLLTNAAKYSPPGAPIEVEVQRRGDDGVVLVSDRGFGIGDDSLAHIFEPFYRAEEHARKASGVGLGLAVCKRLVEEQGGAIWAEARSGGGTVFAFSFPLIEAE
jgi:signal transduction histidine kinase